MTKARAHPAAAWARLALAVSMAWPAPAAWALEGTVTRVSDGDTLWIRPQQGGRPKKVRLQGIDAPELCQPWGPQATQALAGRALHQRVRLDEGPLDDHGRRLGRLMLGDEDLGAWMVRQGHAWSYRWRWNPGPYAQEQARAQAERRGLFADPRALEPREFRRRHGPCARPTSG